MLDLNSVLVGLLELPVGYAMTDGFGGEPFTSYDSTPRRRPQRFLRLLPINLRGEQFAAVGTWAHRTGVMPYAVECLVLLR